MAKRSLLSRCPSYIFFRPHKVSCSVRAPWNLTEDRLAVPQSTQLVAAYLPRRPSFFLQTEVDVIKVEMGQGLARTVRCPCGANNFNINHLKNEVNRKYVYFLPHGEHGSCITETERLVLYWIMICTDCGKRTEHIKTLT